MQRILKPWYLYRPAQVLRRLRFAFLPVPSNLRVTLPWGDSIDVDTTETLGRALATAGVWELSVSETVWRLIGPRDLVVDAGANVGYMTLLMRYRASEGCVVSVEPHPAIFRLLAENLARNSAGTRQPALELYNCALSNRTGTGLLSEPPGFSRNRGLASLELVCGAVPSVQCEVDTLDNILGHRHVDLLKVDVEGHELSLLKGASESLAEGRIRNIVFEDHQGLSSEVCRTLRDFGYHVFPIGWNLKGPQVGPLVETKSWESSNFVATFAPEDTLRICNAPGWRMLR